MAVNQGLTEMSEMTTDAQIQNTDVIPKMGVRKELSLILETIAPLPEFLQGLISI